MTGKRLLLASPRGFCGGVSRAIQMLDDTVLQASETVYARGEIVHNKALVDHYRALGVVVVDEVDEVPVGGLAVFSAHGVAPSVRAAARARSLRVVDATCPLVTKVHDAAVRLKEQGYTIILIGEAGHKEVVGVAGEAPGHIRVIQREADVDGLAGVDGGRVAWLSQTTLNVDDARKIVARLRDRYPLLQDPPRDCVCYASKERQQAVKRIAGSCDLFAVVGSAHSANTRRLADVAAESGAGRVIRVDTPDELAGVDFSALSAVGVASGAATADGQLAPIIAYLEHKGFMGGAAHD